MAENKLEYEIINISVTHFNIGIKDEYLKVIKENPIFQEYTIEMHSNIKGYIKNHIVIVQIQVKVFLDKEKKIELGGITVLNNYKLRNINPYYNKAKNTLNLPNDLQGLFVNTSICHTRAILLTKCAGTFLGNVLIPLLNPNSLSPFSTQKQIKN